MSERKRYQEVSGSTAAENHPKGARKSAVVNPKAFALFAKRLNAKGSRILQALQKPRKPEEDDFGISCDTVFSDEAEKESEAKALVANSDTPRDTNVVASEKKEQGGSIEGAPIEARGEAKLVLVSSWITVRRAAGVLSVASLWCLIMCIYPYRDAIAGRVLALIPGSQLETDVTSSSVAIPSETLLIVSIAGVLHLWSLHIVLRGQGGGATLVALGLLFAVLAQAFISDK